MIAAGSLSDSVAYPPALRKIPCREASCGNHGGSIQQFAETPQHFAALSDSLFPAMEALMR
ncbi:MAG: hypothetical protein K2W91_11735, partial [Novosphingobium sp.]|nr:hypothetical protein [Novosphingobium sp.]